MWQNFEEFKRPRYDRKKSGSCLKSIFGLILAVLIIFLCFYFSVKTVVNPVMKKVGALPDNFAPSLGNAKLEVFGLSNEAIKKQLNEIKNKITANFTNANLKNILTEIKPAKQTNNNAAVDYLTNAPKNPYENLNPGR